VFEIEERSFILGVRHYGKNFKAISEVLGSKTEAHVRNFFFTNRKRLNLDAALKEYEIEHGPSGPDDMVKVFKITYI